VVQSQPKEIVCETLPRKNPPQKRTVGLAGGIGSEFKAQYRKKKKKSKKKKGKGAKEHRKEQLKKKPKNTPTIKNSMTYQKKKALKG
jgi:hypothetical protein